MATNNQIKASPGNSKKCNLLNNRNGKSGNWMRAGVNAAVIALLCGSLDAQQIHVTADLLSPQTTAAMFGKLPKHYSAANVTICNQTSTPQTIALALAAQQTRLSGIVMLPRDAALSVIAAAQGSSTAGTVLRTGITLVQLAAIATGWSNISSALKNTLTSAALAGSSAVSVLSTTIPTHTYLVFTNEALPDPLQLVALGCATGTVIVETATGATKVDAMVSLPAGTNPGGVTVQGATGAPLNSGAQTTK